MMGPQHEMGFPMVEMKDTAEFVEKEGGKNNKIQPQNRKHPKRSGWL